MKTFDEAVKVVMPHGDGECPASTEEAFRTMVERNREVLNEACSSEIVGQLLATMLRQLPVSQAMVTAFGNGVLVGMEMERREDGVKL